jgi:hypothetical protein
MLFNASRKEFASLFVIFLLKQIGYRLTELNKIKNANFIKRRVLYKILQRCKLQSCDHV